MREVLFRGKDYSGKWVYGYLVHGEEIEGNKMSGYYIIEDNFSVGDAGEFYHSLSKVTCIGQWTGLFDKNGQKIFEGDIVKAERSILFTNELCKGESVDDGYEVGRVYFENGVFLIMWESDYFQEDIVSSLGTEVVGNIYDNPELLEGDD